MIEKRKFIRLQAPIGVVYKFADKSKASRRSMSHIRNISGGGVRIMTKEAVRVGDLLEIEIQIPHLEEPISAIGEVVWFAEIREKDREGGEAGIRFRDISPVDLHRILEYVYTIGIG